MANRNPSNTNSSDDAEETLYQINHSRPSSRVSTVSSLKSVSSKTSVHSVGFQQTIPSHGYFIRAHKNKLDRERTHRILQNSDRNDIHAIDEHSNSNRLDRERTHRILAMRVQTEIMSEQFTNTTTRVEKTKYGSMSKGNLLTDL